MSLMLLVKFKGNAVMYYNQNDNQYKISLLSPLFRLFSIHLFRCSPTDQSIPVAVVQPINHVAVVQPINPFM
jgi:hypothetical protein